MVIPLATFASSYNDSNDNGPNSKNLYTNDSLNNNSTNGSSNKKGLRKTIKRKEEKDESKITALLQSMNDDSEDDGLADFNSSGANNASNGNFPPLPQMNYRGNMNHPSTSTVTYNADILKGSESDPNNVPSPVSSQSNNNRRAAVSNDMYDQLQSNYAKQYYQQYAPYFNQISREMGDEPKGELIDKLNYIIHLLEEQQDTKTGHILEELVLYFFLGIFVIFVVDSFARAGKYVR